MDALDRFQEHSEEFIDETVRIDYNVAETVNHTKDKFYEKYDYLKPDCEKSGWEKFCDGLKAVGEWCKEHWKLIVTIVIVVVSIVLICTGVGGILGAAALGALLGALSGGIMGGISSVRAGGSFWEGAENGAFTGAIGGAIGGAATFGLTSMLGPATTMLGSIAQGAGVGAASSAMSNVGVTMLTYYLDHGTLVGCGNQLLIAGISGAISGGIMGGLMGGLRFHFANKPKVTYGQKDIQNYKYNMVEDPGPLAEMDNNPAQNFYGGRYNAETLTQDTVYYRAGDSGGRPLGQYYTTEPPTSAAQVRLDTAVKPQWIDPKTGVCTGTSPVNTVYAVNIPAGTTVYTGPVGPQGGAYMGGPDIIQIFIQTP